MKSVNSLDDALDNQTRRNLVICSVYDMSAKEHGYVQVYRTISEALRAFRAAVEKEGHEFSTHSKDFSLWHVGQFDPLTGRIEYKEAYQVANASEFKPNA